ncbi:Coat F domain-containing protein [Caminicella sporogenes DSM 14501]|uniref:Coat F domain-containing protein n=1 Tax=Caminicella sporogenes DSM 14501 TaxID=1121266 RepID=A0A1M6RU28_9FIRM|nr:spore coat protein [Caminicella sporogenes]RKD23646.1 hypothetical protein BET04_04415 [Caminicella sporogenes]WIF93987.1 spore coat protein [Caminicella sporogenes]SHK36011.1 Coat F domain-containing protein [Caminicella sporogenes DSM 14501]
MSNLIYHEIFLSEREILSDLFISEKQITSAYSIGITESTCCKLRKTLNQCLNNVQICQYNILNAMKQRGWYKIKEAHLKDIENTKKKYLNILYDLY